MVTAHGPTDGRGYLLDNLRHSERLLWGPVKGAVTYAWKENKNELFSRLKRKALRVINLSEKQIPKTKSNLAERSPPMQFL